MKTISESIKAYGLGDKVLGRHEYFFRYLQISPSYWLAHKKLALKESLINEDVPIDFAAVLALYKQVGDVFTVTFNVWWDARGKDLFVAPKKSKKIWLSIDLDRPKDELLDDYAKLLDKLESSNRRKPKSTGIQLEANKIRLASLRQRLLLVTERAEFIENKIKKETLWTIGKSAGIASKWTKHIRLDSKRTSRNMPVRNYMSILVSKNLKDALVIAENAARGKFPSLAPTESTLKFDYKSIKQIVSASTMLLWNSLVEAEKNGENWQKLLDPSATTIRRRRKKNGSDLDLGFNLEAEYEAWVASQKDAPPETFASTEYELLVDAEKRDLDLNKRR